jgi:hypothetical protein
MWEYTSAYLNPFPWARVAYENMLGFSRQPSVTVTEADMSTTVYPQISSDPIQIQTAGDWNRTLTSSTSILGAMYHSLDQADSYLSGLYTGLNSRLQESEKRVQTAEDSLKGLRSNIGLYSSTNITIRGGDNSSVDNDPRFYLDAGVLEADSQESTFRLADTGHFSSIRSLGGFAGQVQIERQLGSMIEVGGRQAMTDGQRATYWMGTYYSPAPVRVNAADVPWLPPNYRHGNAIEITYYLDRPTLASELYIDPVSSEPFDLISIAYTPMGLTNILSFGTFESSGGWNYGARSNRVANQGVDNSWGLLVTAPSGYASYTFDMVTALARSVSGTTVAAASGDINASRLEVTYSGRGRGDCKAGARIVWLDAAGNVVSYKLQEEFPTGFYRNLRIVDYAPPQAASGRIDLGIFTQAGTASAFFDNVSVFVGEQRKNYNVRIDKPKTVPIKNSSGAILSGRFSFIFAQRNPRREVLVKTTTDTPLQTLSGDRDLDPTLQKATQLVSSSLQDPSPGETAFAYRIGFKELDLRYREFVPRGLLVTYPLVSKSEIRRMWVTSEFNRWQTDGVKFFIYPFSSDVNYRRELSPWLVGDLESTQFGTGIGEQLFVFTQEEAASGWSNVTSGQTLIVEPKTIVDRFDGSDREGKVRLTKPLHIRRVYLGEINKWLEQYSIYPPIFDPNSDLLFGIANTTAKDLIKASNLTGLTVAASAISSRAGYIPIKVTVRTDKWTAYPDVFGRPDKSSIGVVEGEILSSADLIDTVQSQSRQIMGFTSWLNNTRVSDLKAAGINDPGLSRILNLPDTTLLSSAVVTNTVNNLTSNMAAERQRVSYWYNRLKADGRIPKEINETSSRQAIIERDDVYRTRFSPVITGPNGLFFNLFWYDPAAGSYLSVPRNLYVVDPTVGLVTVLFSPPSSSYTRVVANYRYAYQRGTEDFSSNVLSYVTETSSGVADANSLTGTRARSLPITRNETDYVNGKIPELRPPDFDRQSKEYWPVIQYYVTQDNELVFARDFFKYGDIPAQIEVEYLSLDLQPRLAVEITRGGAPTSSTSIDSVSLFVREGSATPLRTST